MSQSLDIQEFAIAVAAKRHNPTILTPDFLKYSGIVPGDWELAQQPILTNSGAQVVFQNGVRIIAQVNQILFAEAANTKSIDDLQVSEVAKKYVEKLPNVEYQAISINPRGIVTFHQEGEPHRFIFERLLAPGSWCEYGKAPVNAAIQFGYSLERSQLSIAINEAKLNLPENLSVPVLLFSAGFNYSITQENKGEQLQQIQECLSDWQNVIKTFKEIVNEKFLRHNLQKKNVLTTPSVLPISFSN